MVFLRYWGSHVKSARHARLIADEFLAMTARGWQCHLVLERAPGDEDSLREFARAGVQLHYEDRPKRAYSLKCVRRVRRLCRSLGVEAFACENIHLSPLMGAWLAGVPVRIWIKRAMNSHYEECRSPGLKERLAFSTRLTCRLATQVIAVSNAVKRELTEMGISESKIVTRPNPKRLTAHSKDRNERMRMRGNLGWKDSEIVIVSVGYGLPVKGWDILIRAFAKLASVPGHFRLVLTGSMDIRGGGQFSARLKADVKELKLTESVTFAGRTEHVAEYLEAADVFVMSSRSEGFSNALIEALEAGLPCVATRVGIAGDVIVDGVNGLLVERGNIQSLAEALLKICSDDALRQRLAGDACVPDFIPTLPEYAERFADDLETFRKTVPHRVPVSATDA